MTATSASCSSSVSSYPLAVSMPSMFSESTRFLSQPSETICSFMGPVPEAEPDFANAPSSITSLITICSVLP